MKTNKLGLHSWRFEAVRPGKTYCVTVDVHDGPIVSGLATYPQPGTCRIQWAAVTVEARDMEDAVRAWISKLRKMFPAPSAM